MTVTATARRAAYTGNSVTTTFAVPFQFFEIAVYKGGVLQTPGVHYTITQSSPGAIGSVTFLAAPASGLAVQIIGATVQAQTLDLLDNDSTPAEMYERGLDRLTMITIENGQLFSQAVRAPPFAAPLPELDFKNNPSSFPNTDSNGVLRLSPLEGPTSPLSALVALAQAAASSAYTSEVNAENYKISAGDAADAAEASRAETQQYADYFATHYLGPKTSDPALDNNGDPLIEGALYFSTTIGVLRAWDGLAWINAPSGPPGVGTPGPAATIAIGSVIALAPGATPTFTNVGTSGAAVFDIGIPVGNTGAGATVGIGTVTSLVAGSAATVVNAGTPTAAVLNFGIPRGNDGLGTVTTVNGQSPTSGAVTVNANQIDVAATPTNYSTANAKIESHLAGINTALATAGGAAPYGTTTVASAATTDIGTPTTPEVLVTGTTTITSFGTGANKLRYVKFSGQLIITHNATSLILPGNDDIYTRAGDMYVFASDGSGNWRLLVAFAPRKITTQFLDVTATWVKPWGCKDVLPELVGGGGGGGSPTAVASQVGVGGSGAGGGLARKLIDVRAIASETVTIGEGGPGGGSAGVSGSPGGTTSFGAHFSATGGVGGSTLAAGTVPGRVLGGTGGIGVGGDINLRGQSAGLGVRIDGSSGGGFSAEGGASAGGGGGGRGAGSGSNGSDGGDYGGGASGGVTNSATARLGGVGGSGCATVVEFY